MVPIEGFEGGVYVETIILERVTKVTQEEDRTEGVYGISTLEHCEFLLDFSGRDAEYSSKNQMK